MATERRPYAQLLDSFWHQPWPPRAKLAVANLTSYLHERWRTDRLTAKSMFPIKIGWRQAGIIFGGNSRAATLQGVQQVDSCITWTWRATSDHLECSWPKWLGEHGIAPASNPDIAPPHPSPSSLDPQAEKTPSTVSATEPALDPIGAPERWLNLLGKEPGGPEEKLEFLRLELPRMEAEALAAQPKDRRDPEAINAKVRSMVVSWWRQRIGRGPPSGRRGGGGRVAGSDLWTHEESA
jgi:hypothetical protein